MSGDDRVQAAINKALILELDRRNFLRLAAYSGTAVGLTAFLSACGAGSSPLPSVTTPAPGASATQLAPSAAASIAPGTIEVVTIYPEGVPSDRDNEVAVSETFKAKFPGSDVTLTFMGGWNMPPIMQRFLAGNPPEVNPAGTALTLLFQGNTGVFTGLKYAESGQLVDLTDILQGPIDGYDKPKWIDNIYPAILPYLTDPNSNKIYAVPRDIISAPIWYNQTIFDKYSITPPKTWNDLLAVCAKLKSAGVVPFVGSNQQDYMGFYWDYMLLRMCDPTKVWDAIHGKGEIAAIPGVMDAAQELSKLIQGDYFIPGFSGTDFTGAQLNFFQGKGAMIFVGTWLVGEMKGSIPADFRVANFPFPTIDGGQGDQTGLMGNANMYSVASKSKRPDLGIEWLRLAGSKDNQNLRTKNYNYYSGYVGADVPAGDLQYAGLMQKPGAFYSMNWGIFALDTAGLEAFYGPVVEFFMKKLSATEFVAKQNENLKTFWANYVP